MFPHVTLLSFRTTVTGETAVIALTGELDVAGADVLEHELRRVADEHGAKTLVLDLRELEFMDSTGLRLMVLADERARADGRDFALVRGRQDVHRVFEITRMVDRLRFVDDPAEAGA